MYKKYKRVFVIVVDSFGIGHAPDADRFGDEGADTFGHIAAACPSLEIPVLKSLGLPSLDVDVQLAAPSKTIGYRRRLKEMSNGKDTMTGHWEMMGLYVAAPFQTFTEHGFPKELIEELEKRCGKKVIGNKAASGTEILEELGEREIAENAMIVYTSADSVLQICGNEELFDLENLYRCCEIARELTMKEEWKVGRVIARPYTGTKKGEFKRTANRHDYALKPFGRTVLDQLKEHGFSVISVGKIADIFDGQGITEKWKSTSSVHGMEQTIEIAGKAFEGICFVNLLDFDALWGHRRDVKGYAAELERFDKNLKKLMGKLQEEDLLIVTADHGNDPTYKGTDHTREMVPMLLYSPSMERTGNLKDGSTFADIGATIADNFCIPKPDIGESILETLR